MTERGTRLARLAMGVSFLVAGALGVRFFVTHLPHLQGTIALGIGALLAVLGSRKTPSATWLGATARSVVLIVAPVLPAVWWKWWWPLGVATAICGMGGVIGVMLLLTRSAGSPIAGPVPNDPRSAARAQGDDESGEKR